MLKSKKVSNLTSITHDHTAFPSSAGCTAAFSAVSSIVGQIKDKISKIKQNRCLAIWNKIKPPSSQNGQPTQPDDDKIEINDNLWGVVRSSFDNKLSSSLIKFLSSFICQTGSFELSRSFFVFNLAAAADQRKFFLHESLLE